MPQDALPPVQTPAEAQTSQDGPEAGQIHTPGPWRAKPTVQIEGDWQTDITRPTKPGTRGGYFIGTFEQAGTREFRSANANALLIASAPELLAACQALLKAAHADDMLVARLRSPSNDMEKAVALGMEAIAKATKGSQA